MLFSRTEAALISVSGRATSMRFLGGDFITSFESTGSACESCLTVEFLFEIRKQYIFNHKYDLLRSTMKFEWDEAKRQSNLQKHGIDFRAAVRLFDVRPLKLQYSPRTELRSRATGPLEGRMLTITYTRRGQNVRIISVRRARKSEIQAYRQLLARGNL